jgi:hypothetical protein
MSQTERTTIVGIFSNLLINAWVTWKLIEMYGSGAFDGPDATQVWARMILWAIGGGIALTIGLMILTTIVVGILSGEGKADTTVDERDRLFEIRGNSVTMGFAAAGFVGSIIVLAIGWTPLTVFVMIYFSFALGSLAGDLVKVASYRAGC